MSIDRQVMIVILELDEKTTKKIMHDAQTSWCQRYI
jgi:hypothetical protein